MTPTMLIMAAAGLAALVKFGERRRRRDDVAMVRAVTLMINPTRPADPDHADDHILVRRCPASYRVAAWLAVAVIPALSILGVIPLATGLILGIGLGWVAG